MHNAMMIRPAALRQTDRIAIISPSGNVVAKRVKGAVAALAQWCYAPVVGQHTLDEHRSWGTVLTGGTDEARLADLRWAIADPTIKAILYKMQWMTKKRKLFFVAVADMAR